MFRVVHDHCYRTYHSRFYVLLEVQFFENDLFLGRGLGLDHDLVHDHGRDHVIGDVTNHGDRVMNDAHLDVRLSEIGFVLEKEITKYYRC